MKKASSIVKWPSLTTNKKHFEQPQSCLWMMPPLQPQRSSQIQVLPPSHCPYTTTHFFRQSEVPAPASAPFARKPAVLPTSIGVVLPPKPTPSQKFEASHQVRIGDLGWYCTMARELNLTMRIPVRICCTDAAVLARSLPAFVRLQVLHLGSNTIADEGASAIVHACATHDTVKQLYLHCNRLTSQSASAIGSALELQSCKLELLQLGGNMLGDAGAQRIAHALRRQTSLTSLDVVCTPNPSFNCARPSHASLITCSQTTK
jgi:hypothetical protein